MGSSSLPHIAIFPFLSKGHTIPLIHLAHQIHRRRLATLTFLTTPLNAPFLQDSLIDTEADIIELPFPENVPEIPIGVESTDQLPSISLFLPFINATKLLKPHFERAMANMQPTPSFLVSDLFFGWTNESASKFGIPRMVFSGMGNFSMSVFDTIVEKKPHAGIESHSQSFVIPGFSNLRLTRADLTYPFDDPEPSGPWFEFVAEQRISRKASHGVLVNSFYELEAEYFDGWNQKSKPKAWCVGPVCLSRPKTESGSSATELIRWLDAMSASNRPVLYVAFGSQADVSVEQLREIASGLEGSGLNFLWVVRGKGADLGEGFDERIRGRGRGKVVREWVDQFSILRHRSIKGFVSHCGWNSVLESICAGVPIMAWPMMADQFLNAKFVVDVVGIGIRVRVRVRDGTKGGLVVRDDIEDMAKELMLGEKGRAARERAEEFSRAAEMAVADGGSSVTSLEHMIDEVSREKKIIQK